MVSYNSGQFLLDEEEYSFDELAELRLARVEDADAEGLLAVPYYVEEVFEGWHAYVTPVGYPGIFFHLEEYKAQRSDGGLVRISDKK